MEGCVMEIEEALFRECRMLRLQMETLRGDGDKLKEDWESARMKAEALQNEVDGLAAERAKGLELSLIHI